MAKPVILTVDDEPHVLAAVERDLRRRFGADYGIVRASSGTEALETTKQLKRHNAAVALFLADQRMPAMCGTEFLSEATKLYPDAKKVLLTAYADTEAAIESINSIGLDHYLMKPWDPPEQSLYPVLDDLLGDWLATAPVPYEGIRVVGTLWSAGSHRVKDFLARNRISYQWLDLEKNSEARTLVEAAGEGLQRLPFVFFPDGSFLVEPDNRKLAEKVGIQTQAMQPFYDLVIVGAGPAGLAAAVYAASEGIHTAVIEKHVPGGQAGSSALIENYLGFPKGLSGVDLTQRAVAQARRFGAEILSAQEVTRVCVEDPYRLVSLSDGTELNCHALLIATGMTTNKLDVPGVEALTGAGIYYGAAPTEADYYRGRHVVVVGGANSAGQGAMLFSRYGIKVTMVVRGEAFRMSRYLVDQITSSENIEVLFETEVAEAIGKDRLEAVTVRNVETGEARTIEGAAIFIFIGAVPHSDIVADVVERNEDGFIVTGPDLIRNGRRPKSWNLNRDPFLLETNVPGLFAAGDVRQDANRRVGSAVGEGGMAISFINRYLRTV